MEEYLVVVLQAFGHVVGVEYSDLRGVLQPPRSHHLDVGPGDEENDAGAIGGSTHRAEGGIRGVVRLDEGMVGQERGQVLLAGNKTCSNKSFENKKFCWRTMPPCL